MNRIYKWANVPSVVLILPHYSLALNAVNFFMKTVILFGLIKIIRVYVEHALQLCFSLLYLIARLFQSVHVVINVVSKVFMAFVPTQVVTVKNVIARTGDNISKIFLCNWKSDQHQFPIRKLLHIPSLLITLGLRMPFLQPSDIPFSFMCSMEAMKIRNAVTRRFQMIIILQIGH